MSQRTPKVVLACALLIAAALPNARCWAVESTSTDSFDILHFDVELTPNFKMQSIAAEQRMSLRSLSDELREIVLSRNALEIREAWANSAPLDVVREERGWIVRFPKSLRRGREVVIRIRYEGTPSRGLIFAKHSVYTSYFTCDWMFCTQDRPGDKSSIRLLLLLPQDMDSVGPGTLRSRTAHAGGLQAHVWQERRPYSSYLFGFVAGTFNVTSTHEGNTELTLMSEDAPVERLEAMFMGTGEMLRFFEQKAGLAFPHRRYTQLHVPGSAAQEATSFSVIGEEVIAPILTNPQEDWVLAHELAHQWWGNLVTCADWRHFWLNEGITTFMVAAWKEHRWGRAAYDAELERARARVIKARDAGVDVPLTYSQPYPSLALRRAITYSKGALFMDALRREIGDDTFWRALREFTRTYSGKVVASSDFQRTFEEVSARKLDGLFEEWVY